MTAILGPSRCRLMSAKGALCNGALREPPPLRAVTLSRFPPFPRWPTMTAMDRTPHLLVVDDDREIRTLVSQFLTKHGYRVTAARDGAEMTRALDAARVDLIVLDLMMPGEDGLSICRRLRAAPATATVPIVMLTAMGEETDRVVGLEMGADDYLAKPFGPRELLARIKAVLRRSATPLQPGAATGKTLCFEGWSLDVSKRELRDPGGALVQLSAGEYDLLIAFVEHPQRVLNRDQLLDLARGRSAVPFDRSVDVQVSRLRRKIEPDPANPTLIKTVRGGGYMFAADIQAGP
jgi:two-component system, OmpR family, response regulator